MDPIETLRDIGAAIARRRRELGLNQSELAAKAGVSRQWLSEIENGKERVDLGAVVRTLQALDYRITLALSDKRKIAPPLKVPTRPIRKVNLVHHMAMLDARGNRR